MTKTEQYRRFARECMEMASVFVSERARAELIQMAQVWLRLACDESRKEEEANDKN
jgi:hypothetical protein